MNWRREIVSAVVERFRHTRTMLEARAFESMPRMRLLFSVRRGHVPVICISASSTAARKVSQPVLLVSAFFVSDCLNA